MATLAKCSPQALSEIWKTAMPNVPRSQLQCNVVLRSSFLSRRLEHSKLQAGFPTRCGSRQLGVDGSLSEDLKGLLTRTLTSSGLSQGVWDACVYSTDKIGDVRAGLSFVDIILEGDKGTVNVEVIADLSKWKREAWISVDKRDVGYAYKGKVPIPTTIGTPRLAKIRVKNDCPVDSIFISRLELADPTKKSPSIIFPINSNIHKKQGDRIFFESTPFLPTQTPAFVQKYRQEELITLRGPPKAQEEEPRNVWDRIYQYDVYNNLGKPTEEKFQDVWERPVLGLVNGEGIPYIRRLRTGRGHYKDTPYEKSPSKDSWLPLDEKFESAKQADFNATNNFSILVAFNGVRGILRNTETSIPKKLKGILHREQFEDLEDYNGVFEDKRSLLSSLNELLPVVAKGLQKIPLLGRLIAGKSLEAASMEVLESALGINDKTDEELDKFRAAASAAGLDLTGEKSKRLLVVAKILIEGLAFDVPGVEKNRNGLWMTDEEWGRQTVSGKNPCVLKAINSLPQGSTVKAEDLEAHMNGMTLAQALASDKPRLFVVDYSAVFPEMAMRINEEYNKDGDTRFQYAGWAYLFLRDDDHLVPIAIELFAPSEKHTVYTPSSPENVWILVKAIFSSIDAGFHQLHSHWNRSHATLEPYLIALRRQLSELHPVYKLLLPHFRYTLNINSNARNFLINSDEIIEKCFTPGRFSMELGARAYAALWTFESQALPTDLISRGVARKGPDGHLEVLLPDYPFASDGLLIWNAIEEWVESYLSLYYTGESGETIKDDPEILAWWKEIQQEGHPDIKTGWPKLETVKDLTQILTTIIWTASGHHAAINFGQYFYGGYLPNASSCNRRKIPAKGSLPYQDLEQNLDKNLMAHLSDVQQALLVMVTLSLLANHSEDEQYLADKEHYHIFDPKARKLHAAFAEKLLSLEEEMGKRNKNPLSSVRNPGKGGLPYTLLMPTSGPGVTHRGIPTSVSI